MQVVDTAENKIVLIDSLHIRSVSVAEKLKLVILFCMYTKVYHTYHCIITGNLLPMCIQKIPTTGQ